MKDQTRKKRTRTNKPDIYEKGSNWYRTILKRGKQEKDNSENADSEKEEPETNKYNHNGENPNENKSGKEQS